MGSFKTILYKQVIIILLSPLLWGAGSIEGFTQSSFNVDSSAIETLDTFREAIISGDRIVAGEKLTPDAIIMQAGERATREQYINKHVIPECEYVYSVDQSVDEREVRFSDSVAWISSTYLVDVSQNNGNTIHRKLAELAVLSKRNGSWQISMIHWSNCPRYIDP